ncbi:MAG: PEP-CTERM sorting domain-containing protein [Deltaproteobacteria bacterium]|nr:PEP-CTERM sorting domain-containing protein [Deltaproteobacteria bacterium]MBW2070664.1 PEP-CTERM sorting domain-containing protein [Deltaproteobacteria bacterium]
MLFDGWHLVGINGGTGEIYRTIDLSGALIPADGILLIATADAVGEVLANRDFVANVDWQNGPDAVQLLNPAGEVIDALQYGDAKNNNAGEGTPAVDVSAGWSLARFPFAFDSGDNFADFQATEFPTPGTGLEPVPEPGTMMLLGAGLLGLAAYGRRSLRQDA